MAGEPSFFEIGVPDAARARAFYAQVFEWTLHPMEGDQAWIETPTARGGIHDGDADCRIELYFAVPDIEAAEAGCARPEVKRATLRARKDSEAFHRAVTTRVCASVCTKPSNCVR